ncbi:MAG: hypothetical protein ACI841_001143 [Planctomycetota bacterium]|jgi:hypothetical protein
MKTISRRHMLRGTGVAVALPWLEALASAGSLSAADDNVINPTRLIYVYVPNGIVRDTWMPAKEGELGALPATLEPLTPWRSELSVIGGLTQDKGRANGDGPGDHARAGATFLTGVQPLKAEGVVRLGPSADQIAARSVGQATRFRSIQLGCEGSRTNGECDSGYSCAYSTHISWESATTPAGKQSDPRAVFDRLFRGGLNAAEYEERRRASKRRRSILDFVREDARRLEGSLGAEDRARMEEYQSGLREIERRLDHVELQTVDEVSDEDRPMRNSPDLGEHFRLLADMSVLALRTDSTRVLTLMLANEGSNRSYRNLGHKEGHHTLSHHKKEAPKVQAIRDINRYHVELFAHFVRQLAETREGEKSLLDTSMLCFGSGLADGNRHSHHDLPVALLGRGNGWLQPGRMIAYPEETPMGNLHLALLGRMGVVCDQIGDSTGVLQGI